MDIQRELWKCETFYGKLRGGAEGEEKENQSAWENRSNVGGEKQNGGEKEEASLM